MGTRKFEIRGTLQNNYKDVFTEKALEALDALATLDSDRKAIMAARIERRAARARSKERSRF